MKKSIKFLIKNKSQWLIPALVIILMFTFINYFLSNEGVIPFEYKIFSK